MLKTALAIRHVVFEDLGSLEDVLRERGIAVRYVEAGAHALSDITPEQYDLVIVLGGPMGVYETERYPYLQQEVDWLRTRLKQDLPTLGICLGAQLMASALGARVYPGQAGQEIGWGPLIPGSDAANYGGLAPLFKDGLPVFHWHGDTFDLPEAAMHLASSPQYFHQAFAWQKNALALQFHLEVQARSIAQWITSQALDAATLAGLPPDRLRESVRRATLLESVAQNFWNAWLDRLHLAAMR